MLDLEGVRTFIQAMLLNALPPGVDGRAGGRASNFWNCLLDKSPMKYRAFMEAKLD